jgi:hypothetical protein
LGREAGHAGRRYAAGRLEQITDHQPRTTLRDEPKSHQVGSHEKAQQCLD